MIRSHYFVNFKSHHLRQKQLGHRHLNLKELKLVGLTKTIICCALILFAVFLGKSAFAHSERHQSAVRGNARSAIISYDLTTGNNIEQQNKLSAKGMADKQNVIAYSTPEAPQPEPIQSKAANLYIPQGNQAGPAVNPSGQSRTFNIAPRNLDSEGGDDVDNIGGSSGDAEEAGDEPDGKLGGAAQEAAGEHSTISRFGDLGPALIKAATRNESDERPRILKGWGLGGGGLFLGK